MNKAENGQRKIQTLRNQSGGLMVAIPRSFCRTLGWASGNQLIVQLLGEEIRISRIHLGADSPAAALPHRIPAGKHGNWIRKELEEESS